MRTKAVLIGAGLAALLFLCGQPMQGEPWNDCRERIEHAQARLDSSAAHSGDHSARARVARDNLEHVRSWCWSHRHGWWDAHEHRWHTNHW